MIVAYLTAKPTGATQVLLVVAVALLAVAAAGSLWRTAEAWWHAAFGWAGIACFVLAFLVS